ncbi:hypothetical protein ACHAXA_004258 [Cyclostephanos tholiformis]|uniref:AP2/ERF domain-containing protein n=1 Tax=Cyclostephanos tholiformis TaxID=382380 RepID=A0ABD3RJ83_9STRA
MSSDAGRTEEDEKRPLSSSWESIVRANGEDDGGASASKGGEDGASLGDDDNDDDGNRILGDDEVGDSCEDEDEDDDDEDDEGEDEDEDEDEDESGQEDEEKRSQLTGDLSEDADGEGLSSSCYQEIIQNHDDDNDENNLEDESKVADEASNDETDSSDEDNTIECGSISGKGGDSQCEEVDGDESVETESFSVSVNRPLGTRFPGQMLAPRSISGFATNRPSALTSVKKATSRFKQWMGRKNAAAPVKPPSPKKKYSSFQQERWLMNIAALKAYKAKYGDTFVPATYGSLGRFVRNLRADHHAKSHRLTAERSQVLDEMNFKWVLPQEVKATHAHRIRVRNISKANSAIQLMNELCGSIQNEVLPSRDENLVKDLARQIAQHVNKNEAATTSDDVGHVMMSIFRQSALAGVTEVDLFNAFEQSDRENETYVTSSSPDSIGHSHLTNRSSQRSRVSDRTGQLTNQRKRIKVERTEKEVDGEDLNYTMLDSSRVQPEKIFDVWLSERKKMWRQQKRNQVTRIPRTDAEANDKTGFDYRTVGVRQTASMKWAVEISFKSKLRYMGTFDSQEQAALANEIGRKYLFTNAEIDDIDKKVKLAREAAQNAVSRRYGISSGNTLDKPNTREKDKSDAGPLMTKSITKEKKSSVSPSLTCPEGSESVTSAVSSSHAEPGFAVDIDGNSKPIIDFRTVGVRQTRSGNWEVGFRYKGTRRNIGTFATQEQAALANEVGRKILETAKGLQSTVEEMDQNIQKARDAAQVVVRKMIDETRKDDLPPTDECMLNLLLMSHEECGEGDDRPKLLNSQVQSKIGFEAWLADRKMKWKQLTYKKA